MVVQGTTFSVFKQLASIKVVLHLFIQMQKANLVKGGRNDKR